MSIQLIDTLGSLDDVWFCFSLPSSMDRTPGRIAVIRTPSLFLLAIRARRSWQSRTVRIRYTDTAKSATRQVRGISGKSVGKMWFHVRFTSGRREIATPMRVAVPFARESFGIDRQGTGAQHVYLG